MKIPSAFAVAQGRIPFYFQDAADSNEPGNENDKYYRKELNTGELYLVTLEVKEEENQSFSIKDTVIRKIR